MTTGDLYDERAEKLYRCKEYGSRFCINCGDKTLLLYECCQEDDENMLDEEDEDYTEEDKWFEDEL